MFQDFPFCKKGRLVLHDGKRIEEKDLIGAGEFQRKKSEFRSKEVEPKNFSRYVIFASQGCPWAHRCWITLSLMDFPLKHYFTHTFKIALPLFGTVLEIPFPAISTEGWRVCDLPAHVLEGVGQEGEGGKSSKYLRGIWAPQNDGVWLGRFYQVSEPKVTARVVVPILWDLKEKKIVNNDSADIVQVLDRNFCPSERTRAVELCPSSKSKEIEELIAEIYVINNGVYRCGFAGTEEHKQAARAEVYDALETLEARLASSPHKYLLGDELTQPDLHLFTTMIRFDTAYCMAFRVGRKSLNDFVHMRRYIRSIYDQPKVRRTCLPLISYSLFYFQVCQWRGKVVGNLLRLSLAFLLQLTGANKPDCSMASRVLYKLLSLPAWAAIDLFHI